MTIFSNTKSLPIGRWASEFAVLIIGVLIALAMENWWSERENAKLASGYILDLYAESERNIEQLQDLIEISLLKRSSLEVANRLLEEKLNPEDSYDLIQNLLQGSGIPVVMPINNAVFVDLQSSGRLNLIESDDLRRTIIEVYSAMDAMNERRRRWDEATKPELHALISRKLPIGSIEQGGPILSLLGNTLASEKLNALATEIYSHESVRELINSQSRQLLAELDALSRTLQVFSDFSTRLESEFAI